MLISENWLREWSNPKVNTQELADTLTMAGLEVDNIANQKPEFKNVFVAEIVAIEAHPNSDKLSLCTVAISESKCVRVVCGAQNIYVGMKVPLASVGATLPSGLEISKTTIREVESNGMLCSAMELGLAEKSDGILQLEPTAKIGISVASHLNLNDNVIELELTPNRGDCLSIAGVAKEVSALTGARLNRPSVDSIVATSKKKISIKIENYQACPRYVGRVIENINPQAVTPDWMKEKLRRCGIRPISAVVDITNYVMIELGQPMHAFDLNNIETGIIVRNAKNNEKLTLLDEKQLSLKTDDLLICDHQGPVALAGIMGGLGSGINDQTQSVLLESAYFAQSLIIGKARRIGMQTDASYRFERGVDPLEQERAIQRATKLMLEICGGDAGPVVEASDKNHIPVKKSVDVNFKQINKVLGVLIKPAKAEKYLSRLGCHVKRLKSNLIVTPPSHRFDLEKEYDFIEEIARLYGYNKIPENNPAAMVASSAQSESVIGPNRFRSLMIDLGYHETITYSFVDPTLQDKFHQDQKSALRIIKLKNPIAENLSEMRLSLIPGLLQALANNYHRQHRQIQLFEIGNIYINEQKQRVETKYLGGISTGLQLPEQWGSKPQLKDFFDAKSDLEALKQLSNSKLEFQYKTAIVNGFHPGRTAEVSINDQSVGLIGQILPSIASDLDIEQEVYFFQINLDKLVNSDLPKFESTSKFPSIRRDLSLLVDRDISAQKLLEDIQVNAGENLSELKLFDVYTGKPIDSNKKSVSMGLTFQALNRTLTEAEMDDACGRVLSSLKSKFNAQLRV